jgi:RecA-family ATPase
MPDEQIQLRIRSLMGKRSIAPGFFRLITVGLQQEKGIPSIATVSGQQVLEAALGDTEVLILDSISTLAWIATNDEENWIEFLAWLNQLRIQNRLCIVILHHAGKSGMQRGHSRSEDMLDLSLKLARDPDDETEWCKFQMTYDRVRGDRAGIHNLDVEFHEGLWRYTTLKADRLAILRKFKEENPKVVSIRKITRAIGAELGVKSDKTVRKLWDELEKKSTLPGEDT